jgi:hypothetical protein
MWGKQNSDSEFTVRKSFEATDQILIFLPVIAK